MDCVTLLHRAGVETYCERIGTYHMIIRCLMTLKIRTLLGAVVPRTGRVFSRRHGTRIDHGKRNDIVSVGAFACVMILFGAMIAMPVPAQAQSAKGKQGAAGANSATAALRTRVQQLEGQVLDMQVIIGTLQSLARSGGGNGAPTGPVLNSAGGDNSRIQFLETQIQALTAQVERLSQQIRGGGRRGDAGDGTTNGRRLADGRSTDPALAPGDFRTSAVPDAAITGFGATTVTPGGGGDSIGKLLERERNIGAGDRMQIARAGGDPKQLYETAYGYLLQQNFKNAQSSFKEFLQLYPTDPLAGNAQYWLGETYYVRRKYRSAANAFLKGYQKYGSSNKAPDSLLKLSMSLERLGQKEAACSSYLELRQKFPRAPAHVTKKARSEINRLGC